MNGKTAVVAEGGGQRGIYAAGVFDAFLAQSFQPFDLGIGVSAGSQNLLAYFLEQQGYARRAIVELTRRPDFLVPHRCLMSRSILDLDGYFETSRSDPEFKLPYDNIASMRKKRRLVAVATDSETLDPVYLDLDSNNALVFIKASSAVPFLYRRGVAINGRTLVDGGVADPSPIRHAYEQGARKIVLVRATPLNDPGKLDSRWSRLLERTRRVPIKPERLKRMLERHALAMQDTKDFIDNLPADLQLQIIAPQFALKSRVFGSQPQHLTEDYKQGFDSGLRAVNELAAWVAPSSAVLRRPEVNAQTNFQ
ncbi:MAG: patatin family protein [Granulosicoccus sp.]